MPGGTGTNITLFLPANVRDGLLNTPTPPSVANYYLTLADLTGAPNIYNTSDSLTGDRELTLGDFDLNFAVTTPLLGRWSVGPASFSPTRPIHFKGPDTNAITFEGFNSTFSNKTFETGGSGLGILSQTNYNNGDAEFGVVGAAAGSSTTGRGRVRIGAASSTSDAKFLLQGIDTGVGKPTMVVRNSASALAFQIQNSLNVGVGALGASTERFNIRGFGASSGTWGFVHENSAGTHINQFRDDGRVELSKIGLVVFMGNQTTNFFRYLTNEALMFSSTATFTGYHANRDGNAIAMRGGTTAIQILSSTGTMSFQTDWNNSFGSSGTYRMHIFGTSGKVGINLATALVDPASQLTVGGDIETVGSANGLILEAPDTTRFRETVDNTGSLVTAAA